MKSAIIVNPHSGGGRTNTVWMRIRDEVKNRLPELEELVTKSPGDATRLATQAALSGVDFLIVAGGDGTINETINGLFNEEGVSLRPDLKVGVLSTGRGCDFIRSIDVPDDYRGALDLLVEPHTQKIDIGLALFKDEFGREQKRYFINIASAGLAGLAIKKVNRAPKYLPPHLTYFGSVATTFLTARAQEMKIFVDERLVYDGLCLNLFVANGRYSGSGMCWAPMAQLDDGKFEVVVCEPMPKYRIVLSATKLYDGSFLSLPGVHHFSGKEVRLESQDDVFLEIDGEQPGVAPAAFTVVEKALHFVVGT